MGARSRGRVQLLEMAVIRLGLMPSGTGWSNPGLCRPELTARTTTDSTLRHVIA